MGVLGIVVALFLNACVSTHIQHQTCQDACAREVYKFDPRTGECQCKAGITFVLETEKKR